MAAITVLNHLYSKEELIPHMDAFANYFWERILSLARDVDYHVASKAFSLLATLAKYADPDLYRHKLKINCLTVHF